MDNEDFNFDWEGLECDILQSISMKALKNAFELCAPNEVTNLGILGPQTHLGIAALPFVGVRELGRISHTELCKHTKTHKIIAKYISKYILHCRKLIIFVSTTLIYLFVLVY